MVKRAYGNQGYNLSGRGDRNILALNSGSSSLKFGLYCVADSVTELLLSDKFDLTDGGTSQHEAIVRVMRVLSESGLPAPDAIGHRVVHGGPKLRQHCLIDDWVLQKLEAASAFAPLHNLPASACISMALGTPPPAICSTIQHRGVRCSFSRPGK